MLALPASGSSVTSRAPPGNGLRSRCKYDAGGRLKKLRHSRGEKVLGHFAYEVDARGNRTQAFEAVPHAGTGQTMIQAGDSIVEALRGDWSTAGGFTTSADPTGVLRIGFFGTRATLVMGTGPDFGIYEVRVNGKLWRGIDGFAAEDGERQMVILLDGEGPHTLTLENSGEKNPESTGNKVAFKSLATNRAVDLHTIDYSYDAISRLLTADVFPGVNTAAGTVRDRAYAYTYDPAGNRLSKSLAVKGGAATVTSYQYNAANQLTGDGANTYAYDANGSLTHTNGEVTHTYDRANRLLSFDGVSYTYNGLGQRIESTANSVVTQYLLDVQPELFKVLTQTTGDQTQRFVHGPTGIQSMQDSAGNWRWMIQDALGSIRGEANLDLLVQANRNYEPYGEVSGENGAFASPFGFTGEISDENGLTYLRARNYDPGTGRFFQMDPSELEQNPYQYGLSNPILNTDPTGQCAFITDPEAQDLCYRFASFMLQVAGVPQTIDFLLSIGDPNRNPRSAAFNHAFWDGYQAWQDVGDMFRWTVGDVINSVTHGNWARAGAGAWGGTQEAYTLSTVPGQVAGKLAWGIVTTPLRIPGDIVQFFQAVDERWHGQDRAWDVIFTGGNLSGDLVGTYYLARMFGLTERINVAANDVWTALKNTLADLIKPPETAQSLLMPNGKLIGQAGSDPNIREISGSSKAAALDFFRRLVKAEKGIPTGRSYPNGIAVDTPNGGFIGYREIMSRSPNTYATIDVDIPGLFKGKLKFNP